MKRHLLMRMKMRMINHGDGNLPPVNVPPVLSIKSFTKGNLMGQVR